MPLKALLPANFDENSIIDEIQEKKIEKKEMRERVRAYRN